MDNRDDKEVKTENLITVRESLDKHIGNLNSKNSKHRQIVIQAIGAYIKRYVTPALYLPNTDIDEVVGKQITGLALGVMFDSRRKDLSRPDEKEIEEVFQDFFGNEGTPQLREDFWAAWLVREALSCIRKLCNFLEEPLVPRRDKRIKSEVLKAEIRQLEYILSLPMTDAFRQWIEGTMRAEKEALAAWNRG